MAQQILSEYELSLRMREEIAKKKKITFRLGLVSFCMSSRGIGAWGLFVVYGGRYCTPSWSDNCTINPSLGGVILYGGIVLAVLSIRLIFSGFALNYNNTKFQSILGMSLLVSVFLLLGNVILMISLETNGAAGDYMVAGTLKFIFTSFSLIVRSILSIFGVNTGGTSGGGGGWNIHPD